MSRETVIRDARDFYAHGWLFGTCGNLSWRAEGGESFWITVSGRDKGRLQPEDFIQCTLAGDPMGPVTPQAKPSAETLLHGEIYRHFGPDEVGAVYHVHDLFAALCGDRDAATGFTRLTGIETIKGLGIWEEDAVVDVPILPNPAHIPTLAEHTRAHLARPRGPWSPPCVNILRHGVYAWGATPFEAKRHIESLGYLMRYSWEAQGRR